MIYLRESQGWLLERRNVVGEWVTLGFFARCDHEAAFAQLGQDPENLRLSSCRQYHTPKARVAK